jgi:hypothetical protein
MQTLRSKLCTEIVLKRKTYFYLLFNIILQNTRSISHNEACVIGALVSGYCWWRTDVHVNASYFQTQGVRQLQLVSKSGFRSYHCRKSNFTMYEDENGSSSFKASAERVGRACWTDSQNCVNFLRLKFSFNHFKNFSRPTSVGNAGLENVGSSTSHNPMGLHGLLHG